MRLRCCLVCSLLAVALPEGRLAGHWAQEGKPPLEAELR
jgi:hypothetical protein